MYGDAAVKSVEKKPNRREAGRCAWNCGPGLKNDKKKEQIRREAGRCELCNRKRVASAPSGEEQQSGREAGRSGSAGRVGVDGRPYVPGWRRCPCLC